MIKKGILTLFIACIASMAFAQLLSPNEFLPHKMGEQFTPHYMIVDYVEHVAANSDNVILTQYGWTNQKRPLKLAFISTPENLANLEEIRKNNLIRIGLMEGEINPEYDRAIVWLSFGVHGNEAGGPEAAIPSLYKFADPKNEEAQEWLQNTVVLFDPTINPDGNSRYTHWYRNVAPAIPDPNPDAREHNEPWPGGRVNHYLFDLNRDWAWQTQIESQQRAVVYHQWMPHVHVDFHEQGYNSPYYFAPAAKPYHDYITDWQVEYQQEVGKNHAKYFDKEGWLYFTREVFDLFYPSYGDTYPIFHGAIGMTHEQAGHSRAGRAIIMQNEDTLTIKDRIDHHTTTALSNVELASKNASALIQNFETYFKAGKNDPPGKYKTFIIKGDNPEGRIKALCDLMDKNHIQYGKAKANTSLRAYNYTTGEDETMSLGDNDLVISAYQPLGLFTQVLFEPKSELEDSLTYDITAWSMPYAYGLEAYASTQEVQVTPGYEFSDYIISRTLPEAYAYLSKWESMEDARFLSEVLKAGMKVRYANSDFELEGATYKPGTLVITRADNRKLTGDFDVMIREITNRLEHDVDAVQTGLVNKGSDLGSNSLNLIETPKIVVVSGEGTDPYSFGQVWYYFEQALGYPITIITKDQLSSFDYSDYNLLVMPEGWYSLGDSDLSKLSSWVSGGGRLIAIGSALRAFKDKDGFSLTEFASSSEKDEAKKQAEREELAARLNHYSGQERRWISNSIPGAIFKLNLDNTHPLGYGLDDFYFSLKTGSSRYKLLKDVWNVGTIAEDTMISGFAGAKAKEKLKNSVVFAVQDKGRGSVTYMVDNPLFRGFWENGKFIFSNAVFFVGQ